MKHQQTISLIQTCDPLVERDPGTVHRRKIVPRYIYREVLFDAALLYGGADQPYVKDDIHMLLNAARQTRSISIEAVRKLQQLQNWLINKSVPLTGDVLEHFKTELGEALWLIWSVKRQRNIHLDIDAWRYLLDRLAAE
jgi:hypothetical protein